MHRLPFQQILLTLKKKYTLEDFHHHPCKMVYHNKLAVLQSEKSQHLNGSMFYLHCPHIKIPGTQ